MKALYITNSGRIFKTAVDTSTLTFTENALIQKGSWGIVDYNMSEIEIMRHKVVNGELVLMPEIEWPDYSTEDEV